MEEEVEIEKIEVERPKSGRIISKFALEVSKILKDKNILFYRPDSKDIVEVGKLKVHSTGEEVYTGFISISPTRFITLLEKYVIPVNYIYNEEKHEVETKEKSITSDLANTLIYSEILQQALPQITRIFTIPVPIIYEDNLTFPKKGYDIRFNSWLPYDSPEISNPDMKLEEAKKILLKVFGEFCFKTKQDYTNAIAGLLTPFLRGLFSKFNVRPPIFFYLGNRARCGKDYCAGISGIVHEGQALEEPPINSGKQGNSDELRKKILSAMINGKKRLHFSNNKGFINNPVLESVSTAVRYSDRILGKNEVLTFDNELDFSLSGNVGVTYTPDFANRCRFIRLFYDLEDANAREFKNPNLHAWISDNRNKILSALFSLVKNWRDEGGKDGTIPFTSFHEWANICGGIMECAGYGSPCVPDKETLVLGGDSETVEVKRLFELCYEKYPEQFIKKSQIRDIIIEDSELFSYLNFKEKSDQTKFGRKITKFIGRVFSNIKLTLKDNTVRTPRQELKFTKEIIKEDKKEIFGVNLEKVTKNSEKSNDIYTQIGNIGNKGNLLTFTKGKNRVVGSIGGNNIPKLPMLPI